MQQGAFYDVHTKCNAWPYLCKIVAWKLTLVLNTAIYFHTTEPQSIIKCIARYYVWLVVLRK